MYPYDSDPSYEVFAGEAARPLTMLGEAAATADAAETEEVAVASMRMPGHGPGHGHGHGSGHGPGHGSGQHLPGVVPPWIPPSGPGQRPPGVVPPGSQFPGHGHRQPPGSPPPFIPQESAAFRSLDARAISRCMHSFTYIWLISGHGFWMFPTFVGPRSVAGYRWGRFGWIYTGFDLRAVRSFTCSGRF
ncbi:MAG: hypothetical protein FWD98_02345 [Defluviitaleaceae bacterium]|nr:hypothetical protein [Defluviitaleaceae bacterium]